MKSNPESKFTDVKVTQQQIVDAVMKYVGVTYREGHTFIDEMPHMDGQKHGFANCYGILLLTAKDLELLPPVFNVNIHPASWGQSEAKTLWDIIHLNFDKVDEMQRGDVVLMRYHDVDRNLKEPHHVGMIVDEGQVIHASANTGKVSVQNMDVLFQQRIESIWRMKNLKE